MLTLLSKRTDWDPPSRPRGWYALLFARMEPRQQDLTPDHMATIIAANWHRSYREIRDEGVIIP
jgi:hypothetical protein